MLISVSQEAYNVFRRQVDGAAAAQVGGDLSRPGRGCEQVVTC